MFHVIRYWDSTRATYGFRALHLVALATAVGLLTGCEIAPVLMDGQSQAGRFSDCDRASTSFCEQVVNPPTQELEQCIAEHIYRCVAGDPQ